MSAMSELGLVGRGLCALVAMVIIAFAIGTGAEGSNPGGVQALIFLALLVAGMITSLIGAGMLIYLGVMRWQR